MIRKIAILFAVLIAATLIFAATRPDTFSVRRSADIKASPEKIFPLINDFHKWGPWSPYEKKDPAMKRSYRGPVNGAGAVYEWEGERAGTGRIEIKESAPPARIAMKLDMIKPMEGHNTVEFTLRQRGGSTNVTWAMKGRASFLARIAGIFFNIDRIVGKDFEAGLAGLKAVAER